MGAAVPTLVGVGIFSIGQQVDRMLEPAEAFEDFEDAVEVPHKHERTTQETTQEAEDLIERLEKEGD